MKTHPLTRLFVMTLPVLALVGLTAGCPLIIPVNGTAKVTTLVQLGDATKGIEDAALKNNDVPWDDIESLVVTITKIELLGACDDEDEAEDAKDDSEECDKVEVLLDQPVEVDLKGLDGMAALLSSVEIPAGTYKKIRLSISDPVMVLAADPETEITDIHLTANSRLFIKGTFTVPEGNVLLALDFSGAKIVMLGNGGYVWTPQLQASLTATSADVATTGTIVSVDADVPSMVVDLLSEGETTVLLADAQIVLEDASVGAITDLAFDQMVEVQGTVDVNGVITATVVTILPAP
jgi:hypothetical protein